MIEDKAYGSEQLYLLPEQIQVDERYNVRGYGEGEDCNGDLHALAETIERDGQLDAAIVKPMSDPRHNETCKYLLIAGHRRRRAIALINERRSAEGKPLLRLRVIVDANGDPLRKAIVSNLHRKDFTPMDLARLIGRIRKEYKWDLERPGGTVKVSQYLGMSPQKIREHERFLSADKLIQDRLHQGVLSWHSAVELLRDGKVPPNRLSEVIERAQDLQAEVEAQKPPEKRGSRIEAPSVKKAMREVASPQGTTAPRSRKEILDWVQSLDGPAVDPAVRKWARYFVDVWAPGGGSDASLRARFSGLYSSPAKLKRKS